MLSSMSSISPSLSFVTLAQAWKAFVTTRLGYAPHLCVLVNPFTCQPSSYHIIVQLPEYLTFPFWPWQTFKFTASGPNDLKGLLHI